MSNNIQFNGSPTTKRNIPNVIYEDIVELEDILQIIKENIELPLKHPEIFKKLEQKPHKGILMSGPPGCGKTLIAKAIANEYKAHFILINGTEIISKYYGNTEAELRRIFKETKEKSPSIIFIDEIDSIALGRNIISHSFEKKIVTQLLTLLDGVEERGNIIVIAATNRPEDLDEALKRPGRFDFELKINLPNKNASALLSKFLIVF